MTKWVRNTETLPYRGTSAGGGYSTVTDLRRFADALMSHKLLRADSTEQLITGKVEPPGRESTRTASKIVETWTDTARWATEAARRA
jgi:hypothetical protein